MASEEILAELTENHSIRYLDRFEVKQDLEAKTNSLKLIEAMQVAKEFMYQRQQFFKYHEKPNKYLAHILTEDS